MNLPHQVHVFLRDHHHPHAQENQTVDNKVLEQADEPNYVAGPWWADLGTWGAIALIAFGGIATAWVFFRLPGTPQEPASGYHGAAKLIAIGVVTAGCTLMSRRRGQPTTIESTDEQEHA